MFGPTSLAVDRGKMFRCLQFGTSLPSPDLNALSIYPSRDTLPEGAMGARFQLSPEKGSANEKPRTGSRRRRVPCGAERMHLSHVPHGHGERGG
jgi:hypothetical protein